MRRIGIIGGVGVLHSNNYHTAVRACTAVPVTVLSENYAKVLPTLDGVIVPGGNDINPKLYGQPNLAAEDVSDEIDEFEYAVIELAIKIQLPILGICRGLQLLNVFFGGSLEQDIDRGIHQETVAGDRVHNTYIQPGTFLARLYGEAPVNVNSAHHQAISSVGEGFLPIQWSDDNVIEAMEHQTLPLIGTQWHPERMKSEFTGSLTRSGIDVFRYFVDEMCTVASL